MAWVLVSLQNLLAGFLHLKFVEKSFVISLESTFSNVIFRRTSILHVFILAVSPHRVVEPVVICQIIRRPTSPSFPSLFPIFLHTSLTFFAGARNEEGEEEKEGEGNLFWGRGGEKEL